MNKPVVDLSLCSLCGVCIEVCPSVFRLNDSGYIEVKELSSYPVSEVDEAIKYCPEDCIYWEESKTTNGQQGTQKENPGAPQR